MSATQEPPRKYGVTEPISVALPTQADLDLSKKLEETLRARGMFESDEESRQREVVLGQLNMIIKEWIKTVMLKQNFPEHIASEAGGKIFTFGSYRLGVHGSGSDIDTLCVGPKYVDREEFFSSLKEELAKNPAVTELTAVQDAYVPVIKMVFSGIPIDLLYARLSLASVPDDLDLLNESLLRNIDERCIRSLNGSRVTDEILRLVPNIATFHMALRCIKLWAKNRAVYSNVMGFLGGVAWAMLVARICQLYPNAAASTIVSRFFRIYQQWAWPAPVLLKPIEEGTLGHKVWNPKVHPKDRLHKMPIITPAYPSMCATHNVSNSTLEVIKEEFKRGAQVTLAIEQGKATWETLFDKSDFFMRYKYYVEVVALAKTEEHHRAWVGLVEARLRILVSKLEVLPNLTAAPPYPRSYDYTRDDANVTVSSGPMEGVNEDAVSKPGNVLHCTAFYIGLNIKPKQEGTDANPPRSIDLSRPVVEFSQTLGQYESRTDDMEMEIRPLKWSELPDRVFDGKRPAQPRKRKAKSEASVAEREERAKKRAATENE